jgi:hypothetical protein
MSRDYQRSCCYGWEARYIHAKDNSVIPFDQAQAIVDYVWEKAGLVYPPKVDAISKTATRTLANADRLRIRIPQHGIKTTVLLHEIAHSMTSEAMGGSDGHGARFVEVFIGLVCQHIPTFRMAELIEAARLGGVDSGQPPRATAKQQRSR